jgi:CheY-like chemotaxis protein
LVLVDDELPGMLIEELIPSLRAIKASLIVIVMSVKVENSRKLLNSGANAFVSKGDQPDWLLDLLHKFAYKVKMKEAKDRIT